MLQETALRLAGVDGAGDPVIVCNEAHRFTVAEQSAPCPCARRPFCSSRSAATPPPRWLSPPCRPRNKIPTPCCWSLRRSRGARRAHIPAGRDDRGRARAQGQIGYVRHRRACSRDRLWLHSTRRRQWPRLPVPSSSRSRRSISRVNSWPPAIIFGTRACSCSRRAATSPSSERSRPTFWRRAKRRSRRLPRIWISCASTKRRSRNAAAIPSTMR